MKNLFSFPGLSVTVKRPEKNASSLGTGLMEDPITISQKHPLVVIAGPCVLESREIALGIAERLHDICHELGMAFIFKGSFDKANRSSHKAYRGMEWGHAAAIFQEIRQRFRCPVITDVHTPEQCALAAEAVDILQIPALLCRQTDLITAAAETGLPLNIKKGQFLAPQEMHNVIAKASNSGNHQLMICERGTCFGYNTLVNDFKGLPVLAESGYPIIFDATHSVQKPGAGQEKSLGERHFVELLARAAVGAGVAGVFMETHPNPDQALSDGPNMVPLEEMFGLLSTLKSLDQTAKALPYQNFSWGTR